VDERDNKEYQWITINGLKWMNENLNFKTQNSQCYENDSNCEFGSFYESRDLQSVCPNGWRLPTIEELLNLKSSSLNNSDLNLEKVGHFLFIDQPPHFVGISYQEQEHLALWSNSFSNGKRNVLFIVDGPNGESQFEVKETQIWYPCRCVKE